MGILLTMSSIAEFRRGRWVALLTSPYIVSLKDVVSSNDDVDELFFADDSQIYLDFGLEGIPSGMSRLENRWLTFQTDCHWMAPFLFLKFVLT